MAQGLLMDAAGVVFLVPSIGTPPRPREKRMLRNIFLIARPPLLAVMRGGEFAILKIIPSLDSSGYGDGPGSAPCRGAVFVLDTSIQGLRSLHSLNPWLPSMPPSECGDWLSTSDQESKGI